MTDRGQQTFSDQFKMETLFFRLHFMRLKATTIFSVRKYSVRHYIIVFSAKRSVHFANNKQKKGQVHTKKNTIYLLAKKRETEPFA